MRTLVGISLAALLISGCGGGSGGPRPVSTPDVRTLTGSQAPLETAADQNARAAGMIGRSDSLVMSTIHGETNHPDFPTFFLQSTCSGTQCSSVHPETGLGLSASLQTISFPETSRTVVSKHGVTTFEAESAEYKAYGSWLRHSAFVVSVGRDMSQGVTYSTRSGVAGGDLTRSRPTVSMTWRGLMVGTPATGAGRGNILQGDAMLTYRTTGTLDASFTGIKNITALRAHTVSAVRFIGVPVASDGTFLAGGIGNKIQGGFYGSGHAETAGVFEQSGIVGAFGAKR